MNKSNGDEIIAIKKFHGKNDEVTNNSASSATQKVTNKKKSSTQEKKVSNNSALSLATQKVTKNKSGKKSSIINVGDVGYTFRKQFADGWYTGKVVKIRPGAGEYEKFLHSVLM